MNHYFTINYSFLLPEKKCYISVFVLYKSNNFPYQYIEDMLQLLFVQSFWQLSIQKYYITYSLTMVIKTDLLAIISKT